MTDHTSIQFPYFGPHISVSSYLICCHLDTRFDDLLQPEDYFDIRERLHQMTHQMSNLEDQWTSHTFHTGCCTFHTLCTSNLMIPCCVEVGDAQGLDAALGHGVGEEEHPVGVLVDAIVAPWSGRGGVRWRKEGEGRCCHSRTLGRVRETRKRQ
jgi:hypothetical protein